MHRCVTTIDGIKLQTIDSLHWPSKGQGMKYTCHYTLLKVSNLTEFVVKTIQNGEVSSAKHTGAARGRELVRLLYVEGLTQ